MSDKCRYLVACPLPTIDHMPNHEKFDQSIINRVCDLSSDLTSMPNVKATLSARLAFFLKLRDRNFEVFQL